MPEQEGGFNPENPDLTHDVTNAYLNSSEDEFREYLEQFDLADKLVLNLNAPDVNPSFIKWMLLKYSATKVTINCDQADKELLKKSLPFSSVEFVVTE